MSHATADLVDAYEKTLQVCDIQFQNFGGRMRFNGRIRTIRCNQDNVLIKAVLSEPGHGQVLVIDGDGSLHSALVGDVIAGLGVGNGWSGAWCHPRFGSHGRPGFRRKGAWYESPQEHQDRRWRH